MPDRCVAPQCPSYEERKILPKEKRISVFRFPNDNDESREIRTRWINAVPRKNWKPSERSVLCEKHFIASDFKITRKDSNARRKERTLKKKN